MQKLGVLDSAAWSRASTLCLALYSVVATSEAVVAKPVAFCHFKPVRWAHLLEGFALK